MHNTSISVVMPVFNAEPYIGEQIESILAQDYQDFELLIGDDGSTDGTAKILKRYASSPKIRIFENEKRIGSGATRNRLNQIAQGKYISPCDADDIMLPNNLQYLRDYLEEHPEAGMAYASYLMLEVDEYGLFQKPPWVRGKKHTDTWDFVEFVANHAGSMMRRDLVLRVGGYDEEIPILDSVSLTLKLAEITQLDFLSGVVLYAYRRHPLSSSAQHPDWYPTFQKLISEAIKRRSRNELNQVAPST